MSIDRSGPTVRTILDTLLTETASHVGADELRPYGDANRFVVKLVLTTLALFIAGFGEMWDFCDHVLSPDRG
jgi:hypothetical protein